MDSLKSTAESILGQMYEEVFKSVSEMLIEMKPGERVSFFKKVSAAYCTKCGEMADDCNCA
jgi:hypothetical protein